MKNYRTVNGYISTAKLTKKNTLAFENISIKEKVDPSLKKEQSETGICLWDNKLITRYLKRLKETARSYSFNNVNPKIFEYRPEYLSQTLYYVPDYWYIILAINNMQSKYEFKNFTDFILIPNENVIREIINEMELKKWIPL
jgi:hypothetical protein